jgi:hypothetical protein
MYVVSNYLYNQLYKIKQNKVPKMLVFVCTPSVIFARRSTTFWLRLHHSKEFCSEIILNSREN